MNSLSHSRSVCRILSPNNHTVSRFVYTIQNKRHNNNKHAAKYYIFVTLMWNWLYVLLTTRCDLCVHWQILTRFLTWTCSASRFYSLDYKEAFIVCIIYSLKQVGKWILCLARCFLFVCLLEELEPIRVDVELHFMSMCRINSSVSSANKMEVSLKMQTSYSFEIVYWGIHVKNSKNHAKIENLRFQKTHIFQRAVGFYLW